MQIYYYYYVLDLCMMSPPVWLPGPMFLLRVSVSGTMFIPGGSLSGGSLFSVQGVLCPGGSLSRGSLFTESLSRGIFVQWCLCQGDPRTETPSGTVKSGWYAS